MPAKKCFVLGCKSGYGFHKNEKKPERKISLFQVPKETELLQKWQKAIPRNDRNLSASSRVCELHFLEDEIERNYITKLPDGSVYIMGKFRASLKKGAVPSVFPNLPDLPSSKQIKKRQPPAEHSYSVKNRKKAKFYQVDGDVQVSENGDKSDVEANDFSLAKKKVKFYQVDGDIQDSENEYSSGDIQDSEDEYSSGDIQNSENEYCSGDEANDFSFADKKVKFHQVDEDIQDSENEYSSRKEANDSSFADYQVDRNNVQVPENGDRNRDETNNFSFSFLIQNLERIQKPSDWWGITEHENFIICMKWDVHFKAEKKIILDNSLKFKVFLLDAEVTDVELQNLTSLEDVSKLLQIVHHYIICASILGGRREEQCEIVIKNGKTPGSRGRPIRLCKSCATKRHNTKRQISTDGQIPTSPSIHKAGRKPTITRKQLYQRWVHENRKNARLKKKITAMKQKMEDLRKQTTKKKTVCLTQSDFLTH